MQTLIMRWLGYSIIMRGRALTLLCRLMQFVCNTRRDATNELCMSYVGSIRGSKLSSQQLNRGFQFNTTIFGKAERRAADFPVRSPALNHWGGCQQQEFRQLQRGQQRGGTISDVSYGTTPAAGCSISRRRYNISIANCIHQKGHPRVQPGEENHISDQSNHHYSRDVNIRRANGAEPARVVSLVRRNSCSVNCAAAIQNNYGCKQGWQQLIMQLYAVLSRVTWKEN
jgi:hypothetical protein